MMRAWKKSLTVLIVIAAFAAAPGMALALPRITLRALATIDGDTIRLGQIAEIAEGQPGEAERLAALRLGRAPEEGALMTLHTEDVTAVLALHDYRTGQYRLMGAEQVIVERVAAVQVEIPALETDIDLPRRELPAAAGEARLSDMLTDAQRAELAAASGGYEWNLGRITAACKTYWMDQLKFDNPELFDLQLQSLPTPVARQWMQGRMIILQVRAADAGRAMDKLACYVEFVAQPFGDMARVDRVVEKFVFKGASYIQTIVTTRALRRGEVLAPGDVQPGRIRANDPSRPVSAPQSDAALFAGMQAVNPLPAGWAIQPADVRKAPLVHRNMPVQYHYGNVQSTERAVAMADAGLGEIVEIELQRENRRIRLMAVVTGPGEVGPARQ